MKIPIETIFILENSSKLNKAGYLYTNNEKIEINVNTEIQTAEI